MKPMTFDEWKSEDGGDTEQLYLHYQEEYGDAMRCTLTEFYQQKYREYLETCGVKEVK